MVAIDFEDGSAALVSGLAETLSELGLSDTAHTEEPVQTALATDGESTSSADVQQEIVNIVANASSVLAPANNDDGVQLVVEEDTSTKDAVATMERPTQQAISAPEPVPVKVKVPSPSTSEYKMTSDDVRERMRSEASKDSEQKNPWLNMASYLAGKARDKIIGSEE
jgi:hypothetical protein